MVQRLIMENKPGITDRTGAGYSTWWNGGLCTTCQFHNMIGFFTETIGGPTPSQIPLIASKLLPTSDYLYPITPQEWHFKQSLEYSVSGNKGVLDYAARSRRLLLHNIWLMGKEMTDRGMKDSWTITPKMVAAAGGRGGARGGRGGGGGGGGFGGGGRAGATDFAKLFRDPAMRAPRGYILPRDKPDFLTATKFINTLLGNGCSVHKATAEFTAAGKKYPAGSFVVKTAQPFRPHVLDMFEPQDHPEDDIPYPGAPPTAPYDAAGWTLAYTMGVKFDRILDAFEGPFEVIKEEELKPMPGKVTGAENATGYYFDTRPNDAFLAVNRLLKSGETVGRLQDATSANGAGATYPAGTFFVSAKPSTKAILEKLAAETGVSFVGTATPAGSSVKTLKPVRVGLWDRYGGSMPAGWTRLISRTRFEFPTRHTFTRTNSIRGTCSEQVRRARLRRRGHPGRRGRWGRRAWGWWRPRGSRRRTAGRRRCRDSAVGEPPGRTDPAPGQRHGCHDRPATEEVPRSRRHHRHLWRFGNGRPLRVHRAEPARRHRRGRIGPRPHPARSTTSLPLSFA